MNKRSVWNEKGERLCTKCGAWKSPTEFFREPDGRVKSHCKECIRGSTSYRKRRRCVQCGSRRNSRSFRGDSRTCVMCEYETWLASGYKRTFWDGYEKQCTGLAPYTGG